MIGCIVPDSIIAVVRAMPAVFIVTSCALAVGVTLKTRVQMYCHSQTQMCPNIVLIRPWYELGHMYSVKPRSHHHVDVRWVIDQAFHMTGVVDKYTERSYCRPGI